MQKYFFIQWSPLWKKMTTGTTGLEIVNICIISGIIDYLIGGNINTQPGLGVGLGVGSMAPHLN